MALRSKDRVQIRLANEALKNTRLKRKDALKKLAVYSEDAAELFIEAEAAAQRIDERSAAFKAERRAEILRFKEKYPLISELFEEMLE